MNAPIWLFDGHCVLCSNAVRYTLKYEREKQIRFVALQSLEGQALAIQHGLDPQIPKSFLFIENGIAHQASAGVFALLKHLNGPAKLLAMGRILPRPINDWLYHRIASNRYQLFGKHVTCPLPDPEHRHRFVMPEP